ncbi:hypothetical protein [Glycomyces sp. NPDC047010]|uniref:hypothetical protein n=1 Tax=Glycomyces sp. NPDC047010 TaxID=3155023 RepID=UPI0033D320CD
MSVNQAGLVEIAVAIGGIAFWLAGVAAVFFRGFVIPGAKLVDLKFEIAERRGLFTQIPPDDVPRTEAELRERVSRNEVGLFAASQGKEREFAIWEAWRDDPGFKAEVTGRLREYYPPRHTYVALLLGGVWDAVFLASPLRDALVPEQVGVLTAVWVLVVPLWIAFGAMLVMEAWKTAARRRKAKVL